MLAVKRIKPLMNCNFGLSVHTRFFLKKKNITGKVKATVKKYPESIYGPEDNQALQDTLDEIYGETISLVGRKLIDLGFDVRSDFESYIGE